MMRTPAWVLLLVMLASRLGAQEHRAGRRREAEAAGTQRGGAATGILSSLRLIDLTHELNATTTAWPGSNQRFRMDTITAGRNAQGGYAALFALALPEHFGTHMDAPHHFSEHGPTTAQVPLWRLAGPAVIIDVTDSASANRDYRVTPRDIERFEQEHGRIPDDAIVLVRTGYAAFWTNRARYFGWDSTVTPVQLHFPGMGEEAARLLVSERHVAAVGLDVASTDAGAATAFPVHRILAEGGVPGFENLGDLSELPATGSFLVALTPKIGGGSGGPLRAVALVPRRERGNRPTRK
ncbi:MAG: cyclase family protein [Gemmatimonadaceae bacterium]